MTLEEAARKLVRESCRFERHAATSDRELVIRVRYDTLKAFDAIYGPFAAMAVSTATLTPRLR